MKELEDEIVEREVAFTDDWFMVRKMDRTPTFAEAINWADTHPNWIKVEDRLPEADGQLCVIRTRTKSILLARWDSHSRLFSCLEKEIGYYKGGLSHWMPIVLPKEG